MSTTDGNKRVKHMIDNTYYDKITLLHNTVKELGLKDVFDTTTPVANFDIDVTKLKKVYAVRTDIKQDNKAIINNVLKSQLGCRLAKPKRSNEYKLVYKKVYKDFTCVDLMKLLKDEKTEKVSDNKGTIMKYLEKNS
jgi:hypothetical protein